MNPPQPFRLLFVCTANLCRSVLAERLTRHVLADRFGPAVEFFQVGSAGLEATPDQPMHQYVRDILQARGGDVAGFRSRRLTGPLVTGSDLVLTATAAQRDRVIGLAPAALRRTFTIAEFGRLAGAARLAGQPDPAAAAPGEVPEPVGWAKAAVAAAQGMRGRTSYLDAGGDLPDPRPTPAAFAECATRIAAALDGALAALGPVPRPRERHHVAV